MSCLYVLEINPLLVAPFANIFSRSLGCLFILFIASFAVQKLLSLIIGLSCLFCFLEQMDSKIYCCDLCQRVSCLCFPLGVL